MTRITDRELQSLRNTGNVSEDAADEIIELRQRIAELEAQLAVYEASGVVCQTFRHFVDIPCGECNSIPIASGQEPIAGLEAAIDDYLEDYEMLGENEDGADVCYTPNENDKALIKDAFMGFDWPPHPARAQQPLSDAKIDATSQSIWGEMNGLPLERCRLFARSIEAAHGIKEKP